MADLLTHVLAVYVLLTVVGWGTDRVSGRWIPVAMGGAAIPDLVKVGIVVAPGRVEQLVGTPFRYGPLSTLGGVVLVAGVITLAFERRHWRRAYAFLFVGGVSSLVLDGLRVFADGTANPWLYPFTWWRPPTPSLYVTSDPRILVATLVVAAVVLAVDYRIAPGRTSDG